MAEDLTPIDLIKFLSSTCNRDFLIALYQCPWSCLCLYRSLPDVARVLLMRLFPIESPLPFIEAKHWMAPTKDLMHTAFDTVVLLERIAVVSRIDTGQEKEEFEFQLLPVFRENLSTQLANCGELIPWRKSAGKARSKLEVLDPKELNMFGLQKWENILFFIVGAATLQQRPSITIVSLLHSLGLLLNNSITNKGYSFLLLPIKEQIWFFMRNYIEASERKTETTQLVLKLSFCIPGQPYIGSLLSHSQQILLSDLMEFGLIYFDQSNAEFFYPTSLATTLLPMPSLYNLSKTKFEEKLQIAKNLEIIVETNFKVYVYTISTLYLEMLRLFLDIECILPNLIVGTITRSSVKRAFHKNIKADNLIAFLEKNAHALCQEKARVVPDNVSDQIILWEQERDRIVNARGVLYEFSSKDAFLLSLDFAIRESNHVWSDDISLKMFVRDGFHDSMKVFFAEKGIV